MDTHILCGALDGLPDLGCAASRFFEPRFPRLEGVICPLCGWEQGSATVAVWSTVPLLRMNEGEISP